MAKITLRPYQKECLISIINNAKNNVTKQIVVLATGLGKTVVFGHLPTIVKKSGKKSLILAHRGELLSQAKEKIEWIDDSLNVQIEQAGKTVDKEADVVIASVPTIGREGSDRIKKFNPDDFGLIIVDECHHATASTYKNIFKYFGVLKGSDNCTNDKILLGVTATPNRSDHTGLDTVFDEIVYSYTLKDGIYNGFLADIKAFTVDTKTDISSVKTRMGDFAEKELSDIINTDQRNKLIVKTYLDDFHGTKTLVFATSVEHAERLTEFFCESDIKAKCVIGSTPSEEREQTLKDFHGGDVQVVVNVGVLTEGYDNPNIETIFMVRPTKSSVNYSQQLGRGTRLSDTKTFVNLVDFVDNVGNNRVVTLPSLFGIHTTLKGTKGKKITEILTQTEKILEVNPSVDLGEIEDWSDENIDKVVKQVNVFSMAELPTEVKELSKLCWEKISEEYKLHIPAVDHIRHTVSLKQNMLEQWELFIGSFEKEVPTAKNSYSNWSSGVLTAIDKRGDLAAAFQLADKYVSANFKEAVKVFNQDSSWRDEQPTEKQLVLLNKFKVPIPKDLTKGQASVMLSKVFSSRRGNSHFYKKKKI